MSFTKTTTDQVLHVDYIAQDPEAYWATFILDKSVGFSQPDVERFNDSIRTYLWAIPGSHAQTRAHTSWEQAPPSVLRSYVFVSFDCELLQVLECTRL